MDCTAILGAQTSLLTTDPVLEREQVEGTVTKPEEVNVEATLVVTEARLAEDTEAVLVDAQTLEEEITGEQTTEFEQETPVSSTVPSETWPLATT